LVTRPSRHAVLVVDQDDRGERRSRESLEAAS